MSPLVQTELGNIGIDRFPERIAFVLAAGHVAEISGRIVFLGAFRMNAKCRAARQFYVFSVKIQLYASGRESTRLALVGHIGFDASLLADSGAHGIIARSHCARVRGGLHGFAKIYGSLACFGAGGHRRRRQFGPTQTQRRLLHIFVHLPLTFHKSCIFLVLPIGKCLELGIALLFESRETTIDLIQIILIEIALGMHRESRCATKAQHAQYQTKNSFILHCLKNESLLTESWQQI